MNQTSTHTTTLEAAFPLFLRFGYRKTSMDELARAAGISRQGLYLRFPNKKALFVAMVDHLCDQVEARFLPALAQEPPDLVKAFDAYSGAFVAQGSPATIDELMQAASELRGERTGALERSFRERLTDVLEPYASTELPAEDIAAVLMASSKGFKMLCASREDYRASMAKAVRVALRAGGPAGS